MAIGDISASGGISRQMVQDQSGLLRAQQANDLSQAVNRFTASAFSYLNSDTRIAAIHDERAMKSEALKLDTDFLEYQKENAELYTNFARDRSANPIGMTNDFDAQLQEREKAFLAKVPPRFREEYAAKLRQDRATRVSSTLMAEIELMDHVDGVNLTNSLNTLGSSLKGGTIDLESAKVSWAESVTKSALPEQQKVELIRTGQATLEGLEFGTIVEEAAKGYGVANTDMSGNDVVAAGLSPFQRGVLNAISSVEAKAYNVWNGGATFDSYADHPGNLGLRSPGKSSAAGRYQFIVSTWNAAKKSYEQTYGTKVPDFSPEWQDRVALHWAEVQYNRRAKDGTTWKGILASGDPKQIAKIRGVLGDPTDPTNPNSVEWQGLGTAAGMSDEKFVEAVMGEKGVLGGGTGAPSIPNVWTDERFSHLTLDDKLRFSTQATAAAENFRLGESERIKNEVKAFETSVYEQGYNTGDLTLMDELRKSPLWSVDAEKKFREGVIAFNEKEVSITEVERQRAAGLPMDPNNAKAMKGYNQWFGAESINGIASGEDWAYARLRGATQQFGMMPTDAKAALKAAISNPQTRFSALEFLASLHAGDPSVLFKSGFTEDDLAQALTYQRLAGRGSPEEAQARFNEIEENIKHLGLNPKKAREDALADFNDRFDSDALVGKISTWFQRGIGLIDIKVNPAFERQLTVDAAAAYQDGYLATGSMEGAEEYMTTYLDRVYGTSYTNKTLGTWPSENITTVPVPMKYPPEKYYPPAAGEHDYIYRAMDTFVQGNLPEGTYVTPGSAILIPDETTEEQVRNGEPPTYRMIARGEYGETIVIPDRFGGSYLTDAAATVNEYENSREAARGEIQAAERMVLSADDELKAAELAEDVIDPAELERLRENKDLAQERLRAVIEAGGELGVTPMYGDLQSDESLLLLNRFLSGDTTVADERLLGEATVAGVQVLNELRSDPKTWGEIQRRIGSLATPELEKARREGRKPDRTAAEISALSTILAKDYAVSPELAKALATALFGEN